MMGAKYERYLKKNIRSIIRDQKDSRAGIEVATGLNYARVKDTVVFYIIITLFNNLILLI